MVATITAGHHAIVYVSGAAEDLAAEVTTQSVGGKIYTITTPSKTVLSPTAAITQNWSTLTGTVTVDRLAGTFTSTDDEGAHTLTITGTDAYLPMAKVAYCKEFSTSINPKITETTRFGYKYQDVSRGLTEVTGTLGNFFDATQTPTGTVPDGFTAGIAPYFTTNMLADAAIVIKLYVHPTLSILAWAEIDKQELKAAVDGMQEETISWHGVADVDGHVISRL